MRNLLLEHTKNTNLSISVLIKTNFDVSALMLIYAWIDRMAWLSVEKEKSSGDDFKKWVKLYLLKDSLLLCTAEELWGARCGLLHTGTSEADVTRTGKARKIGYIRRDQIKKYTGNKKDEVFIRLLDLHVDFIGAISKFSEHLNLNPEQLQIANKKLLKMSEISFVG